MLLIKLFHVHFWSYRFFLADKHVQYWVHKLIMGRGFLKIGVVLWISAFIEEG